MESLVVGFYWFVNGIFFIVFVRRIVKTRNDSIGWLLGLCLAISVGVILLFGATVCFDHFSQALPSSRAFCILLMVRVAPRADNL